MVGMSAPGSGTVEQYLDELYGRLRCAPRDARRILAEAEDHLREAVTDGLAAGLTQAEAEEQAVSSFGSVRAVVRAHDARLRRLPTLAVLRDVFMAAWRLGAIGLVAVGVSGLVAGVMNAAFGRGFVGGTPGATRYSAADCHHWLSIWTHAHSCAQAAVLENSSDAVSLRLAAGVVGLAALACYHLARRRSRDLLPDTFSPTVAMTLFGAAGLVLAGMSVDHTVLGMRSGLGTGAGAGFYASGAIVALVLAMRYARDLHRSILQQARG
jgi:vacuolar-type H+-ATPase subunit H